MNHKPFPPNHLSQQTEGFLENYPVKVYILKDPDNFPMTYSFEWVFIAWQPLKVPKSLAFIYGRQGDSRGAQVFKSFVSSSGHLLCLRKEDQVKGELPIYSRKKRHAVTGHAVFTIMVSFPFSSKFG